MDVLVSATECGGIARCGEEVQILERRRRKVDESESDVTDEVLGEYALWIFLAVVKIESFRRR